MAAAPFLLWLAAMAPGLVVAEERVALSTDASQATEVNSEGARALVRVLQRYHAAGDGEGGFRWWRRLPFAVRAQQVNVPQVRLWRNKVEFLRDAQRGDAQACAASGPAVLALPMPPAELEVERLRLQACVKGAS